MTDRSTDTDEWTDSAEHERDTENAEGGLSDVVQDTGAGPIEGDEAMDDDSEFRHTPVSPNANR